MGEIHELFVLALSLVWFAGATPEKMKERGQNLRSQTGLEIPEGLLQYRRPV